MVITSSFSHPPFVGLGFKLSALPMLSKHSTHDLPVSACRIAKITSVCHYILQMSLHLRDEQAKSHQRKVTWPFTN